MLRQIVEKRAKLRFEYLADQNVWQAYRRRQIHSVPFVHNSRQPLFFAIAGIGKLLASINTVAARVAAAARDRLFIDFSFALAVKR